MRHILILFICQFLLLGCVNKSEEKKQEKKKDTIFSPNSTTLIDTPLSNIANEKHTSPYKEVDSLVGQIKQNFDFSKVKKLDNICSTSDGELSEYFWEVSVGLFYANPKDFTDYFLQYPKSCLKQRLVEGIGINISMYENTERSAKLIEERERFIEKAKKEGSSNGQLKFIQNLFKKVNPSLFD